MQPTALIGGTIGALVGAGAWALISVLTNYEIGYVAWAVGGLVGLGARLLGGRGAATGFACAGMALIAIFAGKMIAVQYAAPAEVRAALASEITPEVFDEFQKDAEDFAALTDESQHREFMVSHGYTDESAAADVTTEELEDFRAHRIPLLTEMKSNPLPYDEWKEAQIERATGEILAELSVTQIVIDNLGFIDLLFGFLGIATAFKVGAGTGAGAASS